MSSFTPGQTTSTLVAMVDEPDSPRKFYQLKPREFETLNQFRPAASEPGPAAGLQSADKKIVVQEFYEQANAFRHPLPRDKTLTPMNDVHVILNDNLARVNAAGLNELAPKPRRRSRRLRDFLIVSISLDAFFAFAAFGPFSSVATMAYGVAGIIISTIGLGWVMFFVMDDY